MNNKKKYNSGNVKGDAEIARESEEKTIRILKTAYSYATFEHLHDKPQYWHRGDIRVFNGKREMYGDVKDESVIHRTNNVFAENYKRFYSNPGKKADGWMRSSDCDAVFILDDVKGNLYVLNFKELGGIYEKYPLRKSCLSDCESWGNLVPLDDCEKQGVLLCHIKYEEDGGGDIGIVDIRDLVREKKVVRAM